MFNKTIIKSTHKSIEVGETFYFGQLWNGVGDEKEILNSRNLTVTDNQANSIVCDFAILRRNEKDLLQTIIQIIRVQ